jgi:hypothetical protein
MPAPRPGRPGLEGFTGKSLFTKTSSARSPVTFSLWPAKEFKLANFWDAKLSFEPPMSSNVLKRDALPKQSSNTLIPPSISSSGLIRA